MHTAAARGGAEEGRRHDSGMGIRELELDWDSRREHTRKHMGIWEYAPIAANGKTEAVKFLLENNADPSAGKLVYM